MTFPQLFAATLSIVVLILHWAFVLFVALGGVIVLARPKAWIKWAHAACGVWAALSLLLNMPCPLTWTESALRGVAGWAPYPNGCLSYYIPRTLALLHLPPFSLHQLVAIVVVINAICYGLLTSGTRQPPPESPASSARR